MDTTTPGRFRSPLIPIFLIVLVDVMGFTLVLPFLPFYAEHFGASPLTVGLIISSYAICQFVAGPILGRISDKVGRKPTLLVSQFGSLIGFVVLGLANSIGLIFLARIIDGLTAGNLSIAQAYISDVTKPENRTKAFGLIGIAFGTGFVIGPSLSGFLTKFGYHWPAFAAAGLSFCSMLCTQFLLPKVKPVQHMGPRVGRIKQITQYFERKVVGRNLLQFLAFSLSFYTLMAGFALFLERRLGFDAEHTGYILTFSGFLGALIQGGLIGRLAKKLGEVRLATLGFATMAIGYGLLGAIHGIPLLLVLVACGGFGAAVVRPAITTLITRSVGRHEQGAAIGVSQSLASIAQIVGPLIATFFIQHDQLAVFGISAGVFALAGMVLAALSKEPKSDMVEDPAAQMQGAP